MATLLEIGMSLTNVRIDLLVYKGWDAGDNPEGFRDIGLGGWGVGSCTMGEHLHRRNSPSLIGVSIQVFRLCPSQHANLRGEAVPKALGIVTSSIKFK